jgi:hypothetical protein
MGPLLQEPPARVRLAVMEAAKTQARSVRKAAAPEAPGLLARLWRMPWLLPLFGATSVATVVFLVRVLKNPEVVPGQRATSIEESTRGAAAPTVVPLPAEPLAAAPAAAAADKQEAERQVDEATARPREHAKKAAAAEPLRKMKAASFSEPFKDSLRGAATTSGAGSARFAEPPPARGVSKSSKSIDDLMGSVKNDRFAAPPAEAPAPVEQIRAPAPSHEEARALGRPPVPAVEKKSAASEAAPRPAAPPAPAAQAQPAAAAPVFAPASKPSRSADQKAAESEDQADWAPADQEHAKEKSRAGGKGGPALDETVKRAERLFAAQEWGAAAAAYRDLLSRYPGHKDTAKWRDRMNQSLVAEAQARKAGEAQTGKAAKARSTDVLLKEMK